MSRPLQYDSKSRSPHRGLDYEDPLFDETAKFTYYEINFMMHLMWEIPYSMVHGQFRNLIPAVLDNVNDDQIWPRQYDGARADLNTHLGNMAGMDVVIDGLEHLSLYLGLNSDAEAFVEESELLRTNLQSRDDQFRICLPYIEVQQSPPNDWPDETQVRGWSHEIRGFNLYRLYVDPAASARKNAIRNLREFGVLQNSRPSRLSGGQGNNYECVGNDCKYQPDQFCSKDSNNQCSAMSDP